MSAIQKSVLAVALILAAVMGSASPAAAQVSSSYPADRGVMPVPYWWWSLTVINLTTHDLGIASGDLDPSTCESIPFHGLVLNGEPAFPLPPFRTVTWKSNESPGFWCPAPHVSGYHDFLPVGMDPKWTIRLNFLGDSGWEIQQVYLTADFVSNPDWNDVAPYNITCSYPDDYNKKYNVMTLSGTKLVVTLYSPVINKVKPAPTAMVTLVVRERWPHTQHDTDYDDALLAPCLTFKNVADY